MTGAWLEMTEDQERRLSAVEAAVADIRVRQTAIESKLDTNVEAVAAVKCDTSEIVQLLKGASILGRLARWIGAIAAAYLAGKGLKWW